jgi:hypothetical protein
MLHKDVADPIRLDSACFSKLYFWWSKRLKPLAGHDQTTWEKRRQIPEKVTGNKTNTKQWRMIKPKGEGITEIMANQEIY